MLHEGSPLRSVLYPYRKRAKSVADWVYDYEKVLVERAILGHHELPGVILRLPKVYGRDNNADLATVYGFRKQPQWRWTHGYVENVAAAVVLAATHPAASGRIYNVGEASTPTVAERLVGLPPSSIPDNEGEHSTSPRTSSTTRAAFGRNWVTPSTFHTQKVYAGLWSNNRPIT